MKLNTEPSTIEALPFPAALAMAMMEKLGIRRAIDDASKDFEKRLCNLSVGMAAKAFVGSMSSEMGRRPVYRMNAVFSTAPKDLIFGHFVKEKGLSDRILRERLDVIAKAGTPAFHWDLYESVKKQYGMESNVFHIDVSDVDLWGAHYDDWADGAMPRHNNHSKSKRNHLLQKVFGAVVDGNGLAATSRSYDGNTSDIEIDLDAIGFLKERVDLSENLVVADCKLAVSDILIPLMNEGAFFVTKVPSSFANRIRNDIVYSAVSGTMDESPCSPGRKYYDTDAEVELSKGTKTKLRFVAFTLPGGKEEAEEYIRGTGYRKFSKRIKSLGKYHCEKDARKAFDNCIAATGGVYGATPEIRYDPKLAKKDPEGPCWRVKGKEPSIVEDMVEQAAEAYSVRVLVTNLPRGNESDILKGATPDDVISAYLGEYLVEFCFRLMKSGLNVGHVYIHSPARQDAMIFLTSVTAMIHGVIDNVLARGEDKPRKSPYDDEEEERKHLTMKHIIDFMATTLVVYDRANDTMSISGAPGDSEKAFRIMRKLGLDPILLLGF